MVAQQANRSGFETFAILTDVIAGFLAPEIEEPLQLKLRGGGDPDVAMMVCDLDSVKVIPIGIVEVLQYVARNLHLIPAHTPSRRDGAFNATDERALAGGQMSFDVLSGCHFVDQRGSARRRLLIHQ